MIVDMKDLVALCKRRGFIFPASEIYGGINGFWDYGPLGTELKNNIRDYWWKSMVITPPVGPDGEPVQIVGLDSAIIQNPKAWEASGHVGGFNDPMVDCTETKKRYRADHLIAVTLSDNALEDKFLDLMEKGNLGVVLYKDEFEVNGELNAKLLMSRIKKLKSLININEEEFYSQAKKIDLDVIPFKYFKQLLGPDAKTVGTLTEPRQFNMMFHSYAGAASGEENKVYLRPETCAGQFLNFKNVLDTSRVRVPFGIAQIGKAFRNEVTPRNFIFRSREFEQMELEWFCHEDDVPKWFDFWVEQRKKFWDSIGIDLGKIHFLDVPKDELAHYSSRTIDFEYQFPFSGEGYDELEGIAHRGNYDLTQHQEFSGQKMDYIDPVTNDRYIPHVIEPSCGLTRGVLAVLSEAYTIDESRPSGVYMNFHPKIAPKKAAILPLVAKDGMPEIATKLYMELREYFPVDLDIKQNIGKRYARQDEIGTPYCFTIDGDTLTDGTVTVRERNTMAQERIHLDNVLAFLREKLAL
jgi:glycyl-tRNA synthetase